MKEILTKIINAWWYDKCRSDKHYYDHEGFEKELYKLCPEVQIKFTTNNSCMWGEWIIINEIELWKN